MEMINLANKNIVELNINGRECVAELGTKNVDYFQKAFKLPLQKAIDGLNKGELDSSKKLIISMISDAKTGKILGEKFFNQFDDFAIMQHLAPVIKKLVPSELPKAKDENEKN